MYHLVNTRISPTFLSLDLLFEWLYKNDSLKALSEAGYFDSALTVDDFEFSNNDSDDKRNGWHPEYFEDEENFCDNLIEVIKLKYSYILKFEMLIYHF